MEDIHVQLSLAPIPAGCSRQGSSARFLAGPPGAREGGRALARTPPRRSRCGFARAQPSAATLGVRRDCQNRCGTVNNQSHNQTHGLTRFLCLRAAILVLTWRIYYFHPTQRLPWHFTKGGDFCGTGSKKTAAQGAQRDRRWAGARTRGGPGRLRQHPRRSGRSVGAEADPKPPARGFCLQPFSPRAAHTPGDKAPLGL